MEDRDREPGWSADGEPPWLNPLETAAWMGLAGLLIKVPAELDAQMQRDAGMSLFEYLVLSHLSMAEGRAIRMSQLAELTNGSLSRLSNVVKRMEQRGWVRREPDPADGRFTIAILTEAGWDQVVDAAPGHVRAVRQTIIDRLNPAQLESVYEISRLVMKNGAPVVGSTAPEKSTVPDESWAPRGLPSNYRPTAAGSGSVPGTLSGSSGPGIGSTGAGGSVSGVSGDSSPGSSGTGSLGSIGG
jgi:DNA-binding MarR family transcriptional regulator